MDDDAIELELRQLKPASPSPRVAEAIGRALTADTGAAADRRAVRIWFAAAALPIAAAIAVAIGLSASATKRLARPRPAVAADVLKPVAAKDVLYSVADEGVVTLDNGIPARRQRLEYVGTITWRDPKTNASLTWTVPREEVRLVPVRYQ